MVPCFVFSVALAAFMSIVVAIFGGVLRFATFSASCFVFAVFCAVSIFVAVVTLGELQLGYVSLRYISAVVGVKSVGDPLVCCLEVVGVDNDGV